MTFMSLQEIFDNSRRQRNLKKSLKCPKIGEESTKNLGEFFFIVWSMFLIGKKLHQGSHSNSDFVFVKTPLCQGLTHILCILFV